MSDYNGWTNRATWLVNVWYEPQTKEEVEDAKYDLMGQHDSMSNGVLKDMICVLEINWQELMDMFED